MRARHAAVALAVIVLAALTGFGCIGPAVGVERIHAYETTAIIQEDRTVVVREVIDWDFGGDERHGIYREIPHSGGIPQDITVSSPDRARPVHETNHGTYTEIRIGDPATTISGRHRYVITYVLPGDHPGQPLRPERHRPGVPGPDRVGDGRGPRCRPRRTRVHHGRATGRPSSATSTVDRRRPPHVGHRPGGQRGRHRRRRRHRHPTGRDARAAPVRGPRRRAPASPGR